MIKYIPEYLKYVKHETRKSTISEIINFLKSGSLIAAEVNSRILNNQIGFDLHLVLLYDFEKGMIVLHDPGLPPVKSRKITTEEFIKCSRYKGASGAITVFNKII